MFPPFSSFSFLLAPASRVHPNIKLSKNHAKANQTKSYSMAPLLRRDDLILQYLVLTFLWSYLLSLHQLPTSPIAKLIHVSIYIAAVAIHLGEVFITNDFIRRYKDIWVVANVIVSFAAFSITYLWVLYRTADAADLLPSSQEDNKPKVE